MQLHNESAVEALPAETKKGKITVGAVVRACFDVIVYVLIAAMILVAAGLMLSKAQGKTFFLGGKSIMWIMTGSMDDDLNHTIPAQSYVLMEKVTDPDTLQVGDIICFHSDDPDLQRLSTDLVVHRIVEVIDPADSATGKREFRTRGDANYVTDRYTVKADKVVAKYVENLPLMSFFGRLLASVYGIILLAIIIVAAIFTVYIPELKRRAEQDAADMEAEEAELRKAEIQRKIAEEVEKLRLAEQSKPSSSNGQVDSAQPEQAEQPDDVDHPKSE